MDPQELFEGGFNANQVRRLIEAVQNGASMEDIRSIRQESDTPLEDLVAVIKFAIGISVNADVICALIELDHDTTRVFWQDTLGYLLHWACWKNAPTQVIQLLITLNPRALCAPTYANDQIRGMLPLHLVCCNQTARLETIQLLLSNYPGAASTRVEPAQGLPLHLALFVGVQDEEIIMALIDCFPGAASCESIDHALPLHFAYKCPSVVRRLVEIYPDSVRQAPGGVLPIHDCCRNKDIPLETIQILLQEHPEGAREPVANTQTVPLIIALFCGHDLDVIQLLIDTYPEVIRIADDSGNLPLHYAADTSWTTCVQILKMLLVGYPEACRIANNNGKLPLHLLCRSGEYHNGDGRTVHALRVLLSCDPETVRIADSDGELPLHAACSPDAIPGRFDCLRFLLQADPFTILDPRNDGMSALEISFDSRQDDRPDSRDTRRYLLEKQEEAVRLLHESLKPAMDYYNVPDLPVSIIWTFALHQLWQPTQEQIASIRGRRS